MARITRAESQARNKEQLLAAARRLLLSNGYVGTSLAAIADEAGFSTGVVYSNVSGKAELALAVLREIQDEQAASVRRLLAAGDSLGAKLDGLEQWADAALHSGWPRLELEFALEVRGEAHLVAEEASRHEAARSSVEEAIRSLVPAELGSLVPGAAIVDAILNVAYGVAVRHLVDPAVTAERMIRPLRELLMPLVPDLR
jgi:AcrR family transcriptional regulator